MQCRATTAPGAVCGPIYRSTPRWRTCCAASTSSRTPPWSWPREADGSLRRRLAAHHAVELDEAQVIELARDREHAGELEAQPLELAERLGQRRHPGVGRARRELGLQRADRVEPAAGAADDLEVEAL